MTILFLVLLLNSAAFAIEVDCFYEADRNKIRFGRIRRKRICSKV